MSLPSMPFASFGPMLSAIQNIFFPTTCSRTHTRWYRARHADTAQDFWLPCTLYSSSTGQQKRPPVLISIGLNRTIKKIDPSCGMSHAPHDRHHDSSTPRTPCSKTRLDRSGGLEPKISSSDLLTAVLKPHLPTDARSVGQTLHRCVP